jgi:hypothetical protein
MKRRLFAATAAVLLVTTASAEAGKITVLSPSIIMMGEPAPAETESAAKRHVRNPDVLAGSERRPEGVPAATVQPVSAEETASVEPEAEDMDAPAETPLQDSELRR